MWRDSGLLISAFAADCKIKIRVNSRKSAAKVLLFPLKTVEPFLSAPLRPRGMRVLLFDQFIRPLTFGF